MYLNELCDVVSRSGAHPGLCRRLPPPGASPLAIVAITAEYAGVLGVAAGTGRNYAGPFGKSDRALALGIIAFLVACGLWVEAIAPFVFPAMATLSLATAINRIRSGLRWGGD
jgi:CDP-diacylglycerol--glycerol-3-phosphate 3-phosphatidyltransferase